MTVSSIEQPRTCQAKTYGPNRECEGPPRFDVVYRTEDRKKELDRHPACMRHALAEMDRHHASAGMAAIDIEDAEPKQWWS